MKVREVPNGRTFVSPEYVNARGELIPLYREYTGKIHETWFGDDRTHYYVTPVEVPEHANAFFVDVHRYGPRTNPVLISKE